MTHGLLAGRVAFVTGGARGIGRAIAARLAAQGAAVGIADLDLDGAREAAAELTAQGQDAEGFAVDVGDEASVDRAAAGHLERFGRVDVVVANAGVLDLAPLEDLTPDRWERSLRVNLSGAYLTCRRFAAPLRAAGSGRVVVISSLFGVRGGALNSAYSASKFGVLGLVQSLAAEWAPHGVLVNAVCPGQVDTPMMRSVSASLARARGIDADEALRQSLERVPLGRMARPEEVADAVVFLASDLSTYITGQALVVDGGWQVGR